MVLLRRLTCCTWNREISNSFDFDQPSNRVTTYNGLESCILDANSNSNESVASRGDDCPTNSLDEYDSSCSSSNNTSGSFSSQWTMSKRDDQRPDEWDYSESPRKLVIRDKPSYTSEISDVKIIKEKFAKLLLGDDATGGSKGYSSALALSNAITKLAGSIFGELWKLEPLSEESKSRWRREMEWLLSPTNYMVQLVPSKQYGANGRTLEIMTPRARGDVHVNLPALRKLDSMLIEMLDEMTNTEFWYESGAEKKSQGWWVPVPRVPFGGLSMDERKRLLNQAKLVHQLFKAAKSINDAILLEMPIPNIIREALPKSGKASLGDDLYRTLNTPSFSAVRMLDSLNLKSEHSALDTINRIEAAIYAWKERISEQATNKSPSRTSWSLKDPSLELEKIEFLISQAEALSQQLRIRYPNLPQTFLEVMKIQYGKDVAHAILEAYSRVLGNLAFNILTRIGDISQEDVSTDPNSPMATNSLPGVNLTGISSMSFSNISARHTLIDKMNNIEGKFGLLKAQKASYTALLSDETNMSSVTGTPCQSPRCCMGKDACFTPPKMSP